MKPVRLLLLDAQNHQHSDGPQSASEKLGRCLRGTGWQTRPEHRLAIHGGTDDAVTLVGGVDTHQTTTIDGNSFTLFTLGSGASVYVDDDISKTLSAGV